MSWDVDEARDAWVRLQYDDTVDGPASSTGNLSDISQWHTYRMVVLGQDPCDPCNILMNFYQDTDLILSEVDCGNYGSTSPSDYFWMAVEWGGDQGTYNIDCDYIRVDAGVYAPVGF